MDASTEVCADSTIETRREKILPQAHSALNSLSRADMAFMTVGFALTLAIGYVFGHRRMFWEDETYGWWLLTDPSFRHMVYARNLGTDGGGFAFYFTCRLWFRLVGASTLTFRLYSAVCFGLAFCVTWIVARRFYSTGIVAFALFTTWFLSPQIVIHIAEARFYGLLLLGFALVLWITAYLDNDPGPVSAASYILLFVLHGLLVTSHLLGIVYSASLLLTLFLLDRMSGRWRPLLYLAGAASWLLLVPERTAIRASADVGKPWFWTDPPTFKMFLEAYAAFSKEIAAVLFVLAACVAFHLLSRQSYRSDLEAGFRARRPVYLTTFVLLLVPIEFVLIGRFGTSIFLNRYLMPVIFAQCFMMMEALQLLDIQRFLSRVARGSATGKTCIQVAAPVCFGVLILVSVFYLFRKDALGLSSDPYAVAARMPSDEPVLCEDAPAFLAMMGPNPPKVQCTFLLDWAYSIRKDAPRGEVSEFHLLEHWKQANYAADHIRYRDEFLKNEPRFLVLHDLVNLPPGEKLVTGNPLVKRFSETPGYQVEMYSKGVATKDEPERDLWLVCKGSCDAGLSLSHPR